VGLEPEFFSGRGKWLTKFTEVATLKDVPAGERKRVEVDGELITLFNLDGKLFAIYYKCPHKQTAPLVRGMLNGIGVKCPNHGYHFDLKTGKCDRSEKWNTRVYKVKINSGKILTGPEIKINS
jgi:nitrite reductase/ring-hydroxylating ferredoxin subunit